MNRFSRKDLTPALDRFVSGLPYLRRVLALPAASGEDSQLRASMRRTALELAAAFAEAARLESGSDRAAEFRAAAVAAADLAATVEVLPRAGH
jgi:hypothetical protein